MTATGFWAAAASIACCQVARLWKTFARRRCFLEFASFPADSGAQQEQDFGALTDERIAELAR
jgi:hypothetical protein